MINSHDIEDMRPDEAERRGLCGYMDCDDEGMIDSGGVTPWGEWRGK